MKPRNLLAARRAVLLKLPSLVIAGSTLLCSSGAAAGTIAKEVPGQVEIIAPLYLNDPDVTFWSYAAANVSGCSGNMIGPNTLMSAAHCGIANANVTFKVYRGRDRSRFDTEVVSCWNTIQTLPSGSDVALFYCPNINGLPPGLKYGYMDFDASPPTDGQPLYSIWRNNVAVPSYADAVLYSPGKITSIQNRGWFQWGVDMDLWGNDGAALHISVPTLTVFTSARCRGPPGTGHTGTPYRCMTTSMPRSWIPPNQCPRSTRSS